MQKTILFRALNLLILFAAVLTAGAQPGKVFDNLSMHSDILDMDRKYAVYLPPDYEYSERSYPVLYLLHGAGDDQSGWIQFGEVLQIADRSIGKGEATAMIIVMPDANTGQRGYVNDVSGKWRYEDFFFEEFMPFIEKEYRIRSEKRYRAIAGLSMGGGGSFYYALHRPDLFSAACPLSASTGPLNLAEIERYGGKDEEGNISAEQKEAWFKKYSVVEMVQNLPEKDLKSVRWYIDCGDDDFLYEGNALVHIHLRKRGIPHEYRVRDGGHNWTYWRESLPEVLRFISDGFHQH